jgi:hypothetical protein
VSALCLFMDDLDLSKVRFSLRFMSIDLNPRWLLELGRFVITDVLVGLRRQVSLRAKLVLVMGVDRLW